MSTVVFVNCSPAPDRHCVEQRTDVVFFLEYIFEKDPETLAYFTNAKAFFAASFPMVIVGEGSTLWDVMHGLNTIPRGKLPWGNIYLVSHANSENWFIKPAGGYQGAYFQSREQLMKLRDDYADGVWPADKLDSGAIDPFTTIILKACDIGTNIAMLDLISDFFNEWPTVSAPRYELYLRSAGTTFVEQFFRGIGPAIIRNKDAGKDRKAPLTAAEIRQVSEQLQKIYPKVTSAEMDALLKTANVEWVANGNQTAWLYHRLEGPVAETLILNEDDDGTLYLAQGQDEEGKDRRTVLTSARGGKSVTHAGLQAAFAEAFKILNSDETWGDIHYWTLTDWGYEAVAADSGVAKHYKVSAKREGTLIYLHQIVTDTAGKPVVPNVDNPNHYGRSTWDSRIAGYYRTADAARKRP